MELYVNTESNCDIPHPDVRERALEKGLFALEDRELIMLLLGSGTKGHPVNTLARQALDVITGVNPEDRIEKLLKITGMGPGKALSVAAALELGRRFNGHVLMKINTPLDLIPLVQHYTMQPQEHFLSISLNGAHEILQIRVVGVGTLNHSMIHPREIFVEAVKERACALILCHNHPSNTREPSPEDIETTKRLIDAGQIIGIRILDHIIVTKDNYFSFREENVLFT
ncbi:MAG: DNA repair protein RadC [Treponema sp.]|jgi:DNA repair protein RadC|nr:DNA repair protein RadC [Treponema sp.]